MGYDRTRVERAVAEVCRPEMFTDPPEIPLCLTCKTIPPGPGGYVFDMEGWLLDTASGWYCPSCRDPGILLP